MDTEPRSGRGLLFPLLAVLNLFLQPPGVAAQANADLSVSKSAPSSATVGANFNYTVTVTNVGSVTATGVTVTDVLPPLLNFVSGVGCTNNAGTVTCVVGTGTLNPGGSGTVTITVSPTIAESVTNVVGVIGIEPDGNMANNSAMSTTAISGGNPPPVPTGLVATATSTATVSVSWNASSGATSYEIWRSANIAQAFTSVGTSTSTTFTDMNGLGANTSYLYRVTAIGAGGPSNPSSYDLATTVIFTDDPLNPVGQPRTDVKALHFTQLKQAVNAVQVVANQSGSNWTQGAPAVGELISKIHVENLRSWITPARTALGFADPGFTDPTLTAGVTEAKKTHIDELRTRVK